MEGEDEDGFYYDDEMNSSEVFVPNEDNNKPNNNSSENNNNNNSNYNSKSSLTPPTGESFVILHYVPLDDFVPLSFSQSFHRWFLQSTPKTWLAGFRLQIIFFVIFPIMLHFFAILEVSSGVTGDDWLKN